MKKKTVEQFIEEANRIHNHKFDYGKVVYVNSRNKVTIICPIHGEFLQEANAHLKGQGCDWCGMISTANLLRKTSFNFIEEAKKIHMNKYSYEKVNYINNKTKVIITCPIHGDFEQTPTAHLYKPSGCRYCRSSRGEVKIKKILEESSVKYIPQKTFDGLKKGRNNFPFDFYLPDYNTLIEYDGEQHFVGWNHNKESLKLIQDRDAIKTAYCKANNIPLIRIRYDEDIEQRVLELLKSLKVS